MTIERLNRSLELSIRNAANLSAWRHKLKSRPWLILPGPALQHDEIAKRRLGYSDLRSQAELRRWGALETQLILRRK